MEEKLTSAKFVKTCPTCGKTFAATASHCDSHDVALEFEEVDELLGSTVSDRYRILSVLGEGGWGRVYKARHTTLDSVIAIKTLHGHLVTNPDTMRRFEQEAKAACALRHPNVASVHDYGHLPNGQPFFSMDLLSGKNLDEILAEEKSLDTGRAVNIFKQVAAGLAAAHKVGLLHRDIKPSNIFVVDPGQPEELVKILDFGLSKMMDADGASISKLTQTGQTLGTPPYMSPEQCTGQHLDERTDIYSLGCLMYECFTGKSPFEGPTHFECMRRHIEEVPAPLSQAAPGKKIPVALEEIVFKALEKDPRNRHQSADVLMEELQRVDGTLTGDSVSTETILAGVKNGWRNAQRAIQRHKRAIVCGIALLLLATGTAGFIGVASSVMRSGDSRLAKTESGAVHQATNQDRSMVLRVDPRFLTRDQQMAAWIKQHPNVSMIDLNDVSDEGIKQIGSLKQLKTIVINSASIKDFSFISRLPSLEKVAIMRFDQDVPSSVWQAIASLPYLNTIQLERGRIREQDLAYFASSKTLHKLLIKDISLSRSCIARIANCRRITTLCIANCRMNADDLGQLTKLPITALDLAFNATVTDAVVCNIVSKLPSLRILWLRATGISDQSLTEICKLKQLRSLFLGANNLTDQGIGKLGALHELRQLDLLKVPISDASIETLSRLPHLKHLYIQGTEITDASLPGLESLKELTVLDVINTRISKAGSGKLSAMPSMRRLYTAPGQLPDPAKSNKLCRVDSSGAGLQDIAPITD